MKPNMTHFFRKAILVVAASLTVSALYASNRQEKEFNFRQKFPYKYEFRVGWAGYPLVDTFMWGRPYFMEFCDPALGTDPGTWYEPRYGNDYMTGIVFGEFSIHFKRWFTLAVTAGVNGLWGTDIDPKTGMVAARHSGAAIHIVPFARFYYVNTRAFRLYSSVGLGFAFGGFRNDWEMYPVFQLAPIGLTAGTKVFFFAESAVGSSWMGGRMGIGFRF